MEVQDDSEPDALSESESESGHPSGSAGLKCKWSVRRAKALKKKGKVIILFFCVVSLMISVRQHMLMLCSLQLPNC